MSFSQEAVMIKTPEVDDLLEPRPLVAQALLVLEHLFFNKDSSRQDGGESWLKINYLHDESPQDVRGELLALIDSPMRWAFANQMVAFWRLIEDGHKIIFFCKDRSPVSQMLFMMTQGGSRFTADFVNGNLDEPDFLFLTVTAGVLAKSSVRFCDVRCPDMFLRRLFEAHESFDYAFCDWDLGEEEIRGLTRLTQNSRISFIYPQLDPEASGN